ncbi:MAG: phosphatase PAP2 family protein [Solobacterium sp.]|nr:phosphatase PAP2 family protein [Solobacterium sp.]
MDIEILLLLQEFRNGAGAVLADFLSKMTFLGELNTAIVIMAVVYWCISKDFGTYLLMGWSGNRLVNGTLKVTACVYRPWIRDSRIVPYGNTQATATGYSFPSGHSMNAASVFGGVSVRKDLPRTLRIVTGMIIVLICFSRVFVGVHTPQDVLVGAAAGILVMWLTIKLMDRIREHPGKDKIVMWTGIVLALAVALYARFKSYPADYDAEGKLLVDGMKMANDTFKAVGWCSAFLTGWVLERRYVRFSTDVSGIARVIRLACGLLCYYAVSLILVPLLKSWIPGTAGTVISCFVQMFYITFLFPWWIRLIERSAGRSQTDLNRN